MPAKEVRFSGDARDRMLRGIDILANAVTETSQALIESFDEMKLRLPGPTREVPYPVDPACRLLRTNGKRPTCCRSAE